MEMHVSPEAKHQAVASGDLATRGSEQKHQEVNLQAAKRAAPSLDANEMKDALWLPLGHQRNN